MSFCTIPLRHVSSFVPKTRPHTSSSSDAWGTVECSPQATELSGTILLSTMMKWLRWWTVSELSPKPPIWGFFVCIIRKYTRGTTWTGFLNTFWIQLIGFGFVFRKMHHKTRSTVTWPWSSTLGFVTRSTWNWAMRLTSLHVLGTDQLIKWHKHPTGCFFVYIIRE